MKRKRVCKCSKGKKISPYIVGNLGEFLILNRLQITLQFTLEFPTWLFKREGRSTPCVNLSSRAVKCPCVTSYCSCQLVIGIYCSWQLLPPLPPSLSLCLVLLRGCLFEKPAFFGCLESAVLIGILGRSTKLTAMLALRKKCSRERNCHILAI